MRALHLAPLIGLIACTAQPSDDSGDPCDSGDGGAPVPTRGLPEGASTWTGTMEVAGTSFDVVLEVQNDAGELAARASVADSGSGQGDHVQGLTGTLDPESGLVALAPDDWVEDPQSDLELLGMTAAHDPDASTLTGMVQDYASGSFSELLGGALELTLTSAEGDATPVEAPSGALPGGASASAGAMQCTGLEREVVGEISYEGAGAVSRRLSFGDPSLDDATHTLAFSSVHNPASGRITLVPGLYEDEGHSYAAFFVEGAYDSASGAWSGALRQNVGPCAADLWQAAVGG